MSKPGRNFVFLLSFITPVPVILVFSFESTLIEILGESVYSVLVGAAIVCAVFLFAFPFIVGFLPLFSGGGYRTFWGAGKLAREVLMTGKKATATVLHIGENSGGGTLTVNDQPVLNLVMKINDRFSKAYEISMDILIPRAQVPQFQPGAVFPVRVSPNNRDLVVLDVNAFSEPVQAGSGANYKEVIGSDWSDEDTQAVRENGISGTAQIIDVIDSGRTEDFKPVVKVLFEISVPNKKPYTRERNYTLDTDIISKLREKIGMVFTARVHPDKEDRFQVEIPME